MKLDVQKISELYEIPIDTSEKENDEDYDIREAYDLMSVNPLYSYFNQDDIDRINEIAMSTALNAKPKEKYRLMAEVMKAKGFYFIGGGTNRRTYACSYDPRIVAKVATDSVGISNNKREIVNQNVLKPYCCKVFEISPCGTLAIIERVTPVKTQQDFQVIAEEVFDILLFKIRNKNIGMEDIGRRSFKNWGVRDGFGPVLLDYPTMYVIDPNRAFCYAKNPITGSICNAPLDYDDGFDSIICTACGAKYMSKSLAKTNGDEISELLYSVTEYNKNGRKGTMKFAIKMPWADVVRIYDGEKYITKSVEEYEKSKKSVSKPDTDDIIQEDNNKQSLSDDNKINMNAYYEYLKSIGKYNEEDEPIEDKKSDDITTESILSEETNDDNGKTLIHDSTIVMNKIDYESLNKFLDVRDNLDSKTDMSALNIDKSIVIENINYLINLNELPENNIKLFDECSLMDIVLYDALKMMQYTCNLTDKDFKIFGNQEYFDLLIATNLFINNKNVYTVFKYILDELSHCDVIDKKYQLLLAMMIVIYNNIKCNIDYELTKYDSLPIMDDILRTILNNDIVDMELFEKLKNQINSICITDEKESEDDDTEEDVDFSKVNLDSKLYLFIQDGSSSVSRMQVKELLEILKNNNCLSNIIDNNTEDSNTSIDTDKSNGDENINSKVIEEKYSETDKISSMKNKRKHKRNKEYGNFIKPNSDYEHIPEDF